MGYGPPYLQAAGIAIAIACCILLVHPAAAYTNCAQSYLNAAPGTVFTAPGTIDHVNTIQSCNYVHVKGVTFRNNVTLAFRLYHMELGQNPIVIIFEDCRFEQRSSLAVGGASVSVPMRIHVHNCVFDNSLLIIGDLDVDGERLHNALPDPNPRRVRGAYSIVNVTDNQFALNDSDLFLEMYRYPGIHIVTAHLVLGTLPDPATQELIYASVYIVSHTLIALRGAVVRFDSNVFDTRLESMNTFGYAPPVRSATTIRHQAQTFGIGIQSALWVESNNTYKVTAHR